MSRHPVLILARGKPMLRVRMLRKTAAFVFVAGALSACRPAPRAEAPGTGPGGARSDDLDALEAELALNEDRLEAQGIVVAAASVPTAGASEAEANDPLPEAEPPPDPGGDEPIVEAAPTDLDEDDASMAPPAPTAPIESERDYAESGDAPTSRPARRSRLKNRRASKREAATRCERICDLAEATCDLADHICGLADEHVDELRYATACERAEAQCEAAASACTACAD